MFDTVDQARSFVGPGDEPQQMADIVSEAWASFARTGSPAAAETTKWRPFTATDRAVTILDLEPHVEVDPRARIHDLITRARG